MGVQVVIVSNRLAALGPRFRRELGALVQHTAQAIATEARQRAPAADTELRDSISAHSSGELSAEVTVAAANGADVEFGYHTAAGVAVPAQPYLTPAAEAARAPLIAAAVRLLE